MCFELLWARVGYYCSENKLRTKIGEKLLRNKEQRRASTWAALLPGSGWLVVSPSPLAEKWGPSPCSSVGPTGEKVTDGEMSRKLYTAMTQICKRFLVAMCSSLWKLCCSALLDFGVVFSDFPKTSFIFGCHAYRIHQLLWHAARDGKGSFFRDPWPMWPITQLTQDPLWPMTHHFILRMGLARGVAWWYWTTLSVLRAKKS